MASDINKNTIKGIVRQFLPGYPRKKLFYIGLLLTLLLAAFYQFGDLIHHVFWDRESPMDAMAFNLLDDYIDPHLTLWVKAISFVGSGYFLIPAYITLIIWLLKKRNGYIAFYAATIGASSSLLVYLLKELFKRNRPGNPIGGVALTHSFPSGHATAAFIFFGLIIYLIWNEPRPVKYRLAFAWLLFLLSLAVGVSRIYLRMHFASDVIAGFCLGYFWLVISLSALIKYFKAPYGEP